MGEVRKGGVSGPAGCHRDNNCNLAARAGINTGRTAGRVTGCLERQAAGVAGLVLGLPMGGDLGRVVMETVRPHAVLCQHQGERQKKTEKIEACALHDAAEYISRPT